MKTERIATEDWKRILGLHSLFQRINHAVINEFDTTTPEDVIDMILHDPHGTKCDGMITIYPNPKSNSEYFLRTSYHDDELRYHLNCDEMERGMGGFLKYASSLKEPDVIPDISTILIDNDLDTVPWISKMKTALVVPTINISGEPATTVLLAEGLDAFDSDTIKSNIFMTYATTNILLTFIHRTNSERISRELDAELASVEKVQREFLPKILPDTDGFKWAVYYKASTHAGGDYYDFFALPGARTGVIIADVSGHGAPAAVIMAMARLLLHTYPGEVHPPSTVFDALNRHLFGNLISGNFVTAFYAVLEAQTHKLTFSNAGHCHPLLARVKDDSIERLTTNGGLPLGILLEGGYSEDSVTMEPGDVLVFYTDCLYEATSKDGEPYGLERIEASLKRVISRPVLEIKETILKDFHAFCQGKALTDDLTLVILKVTH